MSGPLAGLRVLELARILAGPWCGQLLADLGADVVKVEAPEGDDTRGWGPPFVAASDGGHPDAHLGAAYFHAANRGKRSVVADFRTDEGRALVRRLASRADVVIENFKVGGLAKHGLDPASLRALNPRLVVASITGFGQDGPDAHRAGYDFMIQGLGGLMSVTGGPDGPPTKVGVAVADLFAGLYAAVGVLAALRQRDAQETSAAGTGRGAHVDVALLDVQLAMLANQAMNRLVSGADPGRLGNAHPNIVPYEVFPASDGHVILAVGNDAQFSRAMLALDAPALAADPRFSTNPQRVAARATLVPLIAAATVRFTRAELLARFEAAGVPAGPINTVGEALAEPQALARGMRIDVPHEGAAGGSVPGVRTPLVIDGERAASGRAAPVLGKDADWANAPDWENSISDCSIPSSPGYDEFVEKYELELLKKGGDLSIKDGDLQMTKDGDLMIGDVAYNAIFRLSENWRHNYIHMQSLYKMMMSMREAEKCAANRLDKIFEIDGAQRLASGHFWRSPAAQEAWDAHWDQKGATVAGQRTFAGCLILLMSNALKRFQDDIDATDEEWRASGLLFGKVSVGQLIHASANGFRHEDEWAKSRTPTKRQKASQEVLSAALGLGLFDLDRSPGRCTEILRLLSVGQAFEGITKTVVGFAHQIAETRNRKIESQKI